MIRKTDPDAIRPFLEDASGMACGAADDVAFPESAEDVSELLSSAELTATPITFSGGGTGLAGGRIPQGGSVLAADRLGGVRDVRVTEAGGILVSGPAATLQEIETAAAASGLFLPPDPTETLAWIGGAVATNASGSRTFHYGPMRRWVRRLDLVLADGTRLKAERGRYVAGSDGTFRLPCAAGERVVPVPRGLGRNVKSATGYASAQGLDLVDLIVGSEGTLAAITEVELDLLPLPEAVLTGLVFFRSEEDCLETVRAARRRSCTARGYGGPAPSTALVRPAASRQLLARALEFFGGDALEFVRQGGKNLPAGAGAALLFEQEHTAEDEEAVAEAWLELLETHAALLEDAWIAQDATSRRSIREFRHALPAGVNEWLSRNGRRKHGTDIAVPDQGFSEMFQAYRRDIAAAEIGSVTFGHVGDNHLHVNLLPRDDEEELRCWELLRGWVRRAVALGGVPSAEHGIGKLKASLLAEVADPDLLASMRATKAALDPQGILGQGTLFGRSPGGPAGALR